MHPGVGGSEGVRGRLTVLYFCILYSVYCRYCRYCNLFRPLHALRPLASADWSDGVSRDLAHDPLAAELGFVLQQMSEPAPAWRHDWKPLWQYAERAVRTRRWEE